MRFDLQFSFRTTVQALLAPLVLILAATANADPVEGSQSRFESWRGVYSAWERREDGLPGRVSPSFARLSSTALSGIPVPWIDMAGFGNALLRYDGRRYFSSSSPGDFEDSAGSGAFGFSSAQDSGTTAMLLASLCLMLLVIGRRAMDVDARIIRRPVREPEAWHGSAPILPLHEDDVSVDFHRPVHAVLGMPVDTLTLQTAQEKIYAAAAASRPCFLSTPNLNFAINCVNDDRFRDSVINSDLSLADGMPLIWVARILGMPISERVAGSDLFARLQQSDRALSVYLFGGQDGVAQRAADNINAARCGLQCVGWKSPGFGSIGDMSDEATIRDINGSGADFLVVALGAGKGQAWIERNRPRLSVPVISHLGAVMNFVAGGVRRAPPWMQRAGLEWLWRIKEEPELLRRYLRDGSVFLRIMMTRVLPGALYQRWGRPEPQVFANAGVSLSREGCWVRIIPHGAWCEGNLARMREICEQVARQQVNVTIDLIDACFVDSAFIGLLMLMHGHQGRHGLGFRICGVTSSLQRMFRSHCADFLLQTGHMTDFATRTDAGQWRQPAFGSIS